MAALDPMDSLLSSDFTYSFSKYSCIRAAYTPHITFAYVIALSGLGCLVTRIIPALKPAHVWLGRVYILSMLWCTAFSLLIHNTGLPAAVLWSFLWVLLGLTFGWLVINIHQVRTNRAAMHQVQEIIKLNGLQGDLSTLMAKAKADIATEKTFWQRFFSLKTLHALLFFTSWINIVGRIAASRTWYEFTCDTYPYYKMIDTREFQGANANLTAVPVHDPRYSRLPWAKMGNGTWGALLCIGPLAIGAIVGALWSSVAACYAARHRPLAQQRLSS